MTAVSLTAAPSSAQSSRLCWGVRFRDGADNTDMHKLRPGVRSCTAFLLGCALCNVAFAQSIAVRLLNGKTGKPLSKVRVYIILGDPKHQHAFDLKTDRDGNVRFDPSEEKTFQVRPIGEVACGEQPIGAPDRDYSVDEVVQSGLVTANDCGHLAPEPIRGQLTYLVRPATWTELFRN
jgi:hypothetical protein